MSSAHRLVLALLASALPAAACGDDGGPTPPPAGTGVALADLGTFDFPVFLTAPPGDLDRVFVVEKRGTIQVVRLDSREASTFLDLSGLVSTGSEQGLLGLAFHPQYAANRLLIVDYTDLSGDTKIAVFETSAGDPDRADPASERVLLTIPQPFDNHNGGMVVFGPDGMLYVGMGDGGSGGDPMGNGQNLGSPLGKILRLAVSAAGQLSIPADNPFVGQAGARGEIWSYGFRNPWRLSFDRSTGDLYIGDVGQAEREEIDVALAAEGSGRGSNYGWNVMEGTECYAQSTCDRTGLTLPVLDYTHADGCSVTGGYVYRGSIASLRGQYFYADLCGGWVRSFRLAGGTVTEAREWPDLRPGGSITSFGEDGSAELYVMTSDGRVARIVERP